MPLALFCPTCSTALVPDRFSDVPVSRCPRCATVWCDRTDLNAIVARLSPGFLMHWGQLVTGPSGDTTGACPRCGRRLAAYQLEGVDFERCANCRGVAIRQDALDHLIDLARRDVAQGVHSARASAALTELAEVLADVGYVGSVRREA